MGCLPFLLHTITVRLDADPQQPDVNVQTDMERFVWNFLAFATASNVTNAKDGQLMALERCRPANASIACQNGTVCAGSRDVSGFEGTGVCLNATVRFVPSYSTALECVACNGTATYYDFRWRVTDQAKQWEAQYGWPVDPMWTESNWPSGQPSIVLYLQEAPGVDVAVLGAGIAVTVAAGAMALAVHLAWTRRLKQE